MYKVKNNLPPLYFVEMFELNSDVHNYSTRQADSYHIRLTVTLHSIRISGDKLWNNISNMLNNRACKRKARFISEIFF